MPARRAARQDSLALPPLRREARAAQRAGAQVLLIASLLVGVGIVMVYSASSVLGEVRFGGSSFFLERQGVRALCGLVLMLALARVPTACWSRLSRSLLLAGIASLVVLLVVAESRWLRLPWFSLQPSEFVKVALVLYLADVVTRKEQLMVDLRLGLLPRLVTIGVVLLLTAVQPDLGTAIAMGVISMAMLWVGGARLAHLLLAALAAAPLVAVSLTVSAYQLERVQKFLHGGNYQLDQALLALGSGGWFGLGLGNSLQKQQFLPEPHTDFVFAMIGEEMGLAGTLSVLALFAALAIHGLRIARDARTQYDFLVATGVTLMISIYAALNVGVATGLLPTTGLPLPFISYGGSSLIGNLAAVGILAGVARSTASHALREGAIIPAVGATAAWRP